MGWYLRKSFGFGPFRLNLSKSGIGYSMGVRGARIGVGPRGHYVRLGKGGVYYQKYFTPSVASPRVARGTSPPVFIQEVGTPVTTADVSELRDSTSENLLIEIQERQAKARLAPIVASLSGIFVVALLAVKMPLWVTIPSIPLLAVIHGYFARRDHEKKLTELNYELDSDTRKRYVELLNAMHGFASSARIWRVMSHQNSVDRKYHGGAQTLLDRKDVALRLSAPPSIETKVAVWRMTLGDQTLYFFPDRILVYQGTQVGAVAYSDFLVTIGQTRFVEQSRVPSDAQVVDYTWQYVNKGGGPDRRFSNNPQIPIVLYPELHLCSGSGMTIALISSNCNKASSFKDGLRGYTLSRL